MAEVYETPDHNSPEPEEVFVDTLARKELRAEYVQLAVFKKYAMATFLVLISSAIIEGKFSEFLGLKSTHRSRMCDSNVSSCLSTRVAMPVHADPAMAFNPDPVTAGLGGSEQLSRGVARLCVGVGLCDTLRGSVLLCGAVCCSAPAGC